VIGIDGQKPAVGGRGRTWSISLMASSGTAASSMTCSPTRAWAV